MTMPMSMPALMAWNRNTAWIASRTASLPRNENETLLTPPLTSTSGSSRLMPFGRGEVGVAVVGMLLDARADGEDVRVDDHVGRIEAGLLGEQVVGAVQDRDLPLDRIGLALLVEGHDDDGGAVAAREASLAQELFLAFLEADRVDDRPALDVLQAFFDHVPLRRIDHHRDLGDVGLGRDQVEEARHRCLGPSSSASSMLMSIIWAPLSTCCRAIATASSSRSSLISRAKAREPVTLVRSPTFTNSESGRMSSGSRPARRVAGSTVGIVPRRKAGDRRDDRAGVLRGGAAARADHVERALAREPAEA